MNKQIKDYPKWVQEILIEREIYFMSNGIASIEVMEADSIWLEAKNGNLKPLADFHGIKIDENGEEVVEMPIISQDSKIEQKQNIKDAYNQGYRDGFLDAQSESIGGKDIAEFDNAENYYNEHFKTK